MQKFSTAGLTITVIVIPFMYFLSRSKYDLADRLSSRALCGDTAESASCLCLSVTIAVALLGRLLFRAWWIDGAASVLIAFFVAREARESLEGAAL